MEVRRLSNDELYHHGIKGQKWGVRRYQNPDGSLTAEGKKKYGSVENYNKHNNNVFKSLAAAQVANFGINAYMYSKSIDKSDKTRYGILASAAAISLGMAVGKKIYEHNKNKKLTDKDVNKSVSKGKDIVKKLKRDKHITDISTVNGISKRVNPIESQDSKMKRFKREAEKSRRRSI